MRKRLLFIFITTILLFTLSLNGQTNSRHVSVSGYTRSNGTYVEPYHRTAPNNTNIDNFSTKGNVNPYTGRNGTIEPDNYQPINSNIGSNYEPLMPSSLNINNMSLNTDKKYRNHSNDLIIYDKAKYPSTNRSKTTSIKSTSFVDRPSHSNYHKKHIHHTKVSTNDHNPSTLYAHKTIRKLDYKKEKGHSQMYKQVNSINSKSYSVRKKHHKRSHKKGY